MKYVQSFYPYPVIYSSIGKGIPSKDADGELRNIAAFEEAEIETLKASEPMFRELLNLKKYRILDHLPESYKPSATLINEAHAENERLKKELEELKAKATGGDVSKTDPKSGGGETPVADGGAGDGAAGGDNAAGGAATGDKVDLEKMEYKELQEYALKLGIEKVTNVKKADLIKSIEEAQSRAAQ